MPTKTSYLSMTSPRNDPRIAVLIATSGRIDLLGARALPSVWSQTRQPDVVVIVTDCAADALSEESLRQAIDRSAPDVGQRPEVITLRNRRTSPSASGAWNSGLDELCRRYGGAANEWYVAVLDDDDAWEPDHLALCHGQAIASGADMVVPGLIRIEGEVAEGLRQGIPSALDTSALFVRNTHIQGSNLFLRLSRFLEVGGFDENLASCTDRDLCIRLSRLDGFVYVPVQAHTVRHFADARPDRLTVCRKSKKDGLVAFWRKHSRDFPKELHAEFLKMAQGRFGFGPENFVPSPASQGADRPVADDPVVVGTLPLVLGVASDSNFPKHVRRLLGDVKGLVGHPGVDSVCLVLYENGPVCPKGRAEWEAQLTVLKDAGVSVRHVRPEDVSDGWADEQIFELPDPVANRLPIAITRSILNHYVREECGCRPGSVAWILDDDKSFTYEVRLEGSGRMREVCSPNVPQLIALRNAGVDVVIGQDSSAAPLPFEATLRLQLLDLERCLRNFAAGRSLANDDALSAVGDSNAYYDLGRDTRYLETPSGYRLAGSASADETLEEIARICERLRAGESVTRPLMVDERTLPVSAAQDSIMRGGSTIFFNPDHLVLFPQYAARIGREWLRRSDMLHSLVLQKLHGVRIVMHPAVAVRHCREDARPIARISDTCRIDILGFGFYRAVEKVISEAPESQGSLARVLGGDGLKVASAAAQKFARERAAALQLSSWRVQGLVGACLVALRSMREQAAASPAAIGSLEAELLKIKELLDPAKVSEVVDGLRKMLDDSDGLVRDYERLLSEAHAIQWHYFPERRPGLVDDRVECGRRRLGLTNQAKVVGVGSEGVVFEDGGDAVKLLDLSKPSQISRALPALRRLAGMPSPSGYTTIQPIDLSRTACGAWVVRRKYVAGVAGLAPRLEQMARLLDECRSVGIAFRNISRANLACTGDGVALIDYGSDFREHSQEEFEAMARRAWMCVQYWERLDLPRLLSLGKRGHDAPEFEGFEGFLRNLSGNRLSATQICDQLVDRLLEGTGSRKVLDYGCGKQAHTARRLAALGNAVVGYDPGSGMEARWMRSVPRLPNLILTGSRDEALAAGPYDAVVCSLVLCELGSDADFRQAVSDLGAAVNRHGKVVIVICDPVGTFGASTPIHKRRDLPAGTTYSESFAYDEIAESGHPRTEFHRPLRRIRQELAKAGLLIAKEIWNEASDGNKGLPACDFLAWECRPIDIDHAKAKVSLVIKASALEGARLRPQVEHLVDQLESPRAFHEKILVIDSRLGHFVRQYQEPDFAATRDVAESLLARGYVDKVIIGPKEGSETARRINRDWFGLETASTHSSKLAPLAAPLSAFEACEGDYILQVDTDLLVRRADRGHDYIGDAISALKATPGAFTIGLNIVQRDNVALHDKDDAGVPIRVECRGCLFDRNALLSLRPYPNALSPDGSPELSWHRSLDRTCQEGGARSLRGGDRRTGFVHPENNFKRSADEWNVVMSAIESGGLCARQFGEVNLVGSALEWLPSRRTEPFVFVVTGRNVPYGKMKRCLDSMLRQHGQSWGAVVIDDGSDELARESARRLFSGHPNITLLQPRVRRGQMANTVLAVRSLCTDPSAVIVTLDMDDALIGDCVLAELNHAYQQGADLTVGSMVRTDKHAEYPANFVDLHAARGGNIWQHLRSFRKGLFDRIPDWRLRLDGGYVSVCVDWAFMLPMVEQAESPRHIERKLYLYEPSGLGKGDQRAEREAAIGRLMRRHRPGGPVRRSSRLLTKEDISKCDWSSKEGLLLIRHADRPKLKGLSKHDADNVDITEKGREESRALGVAIAQATEVVSSEVRRARQTAMEVMHGLGLGQRDPRVFSSLCVLSSRIGDASEVYRSHKGRLGWDPLMDVWLDGIISECSSIVPSSRSAIMALADLLGPNGVEARGLNVAVTHDFYVFALLEAMHGLRQWPERGIPTLSGVYVDYEDARLLIDAYANG